MKPDGPQPLEDAVRDALAGMPPAMVEALRRHPHRLRDLLHLMGLMGIILDRGEAGVEMLPATVEALRRDPDHLRNLLHLMEVFLDRREDGVETVTPVVGPELSPEEIERGIAGRTIPYEPAEEVLNSREAAERIGLKSHQAVHDRLRSGEIVGWETAKHGHVFPARQFDDRGRVIPGVCEIVKELGGDAYGAWAWLTAPDAACGGEEPLALLSRGERERVLASARGYWQGDFS